jgi:hypothetical protein
MLKLNAGISRKVGEPNYGSRGASVNLELEVESGLVQDPDGLMDRVRRLFALARDAVNDELNGSRQPSAKVRTGGDGRNNEGGEGNGRPATVSQVRAIRAICKQRDLDADQTASERFDVSGVEELTLTEASTLIDELKAQPAKGRGRAR